MSKRKIVKISNSASSLVVVYDDGCWIEIPTED